MQSFKRFPFKTRQQLHVYRKMLQQWNQKINLIGPATSNHIIRDHIADGLAVLRYLPTHSVNILDIGTGGGVPGMVLGICTNYPVHLVESNAKKCGFLRAVVAELGLDNVNIYQERIERCSLPQIDIITARACAGVKQLLEWGNCHAHENTQYILLKGARVQEELSALDKHSFNVIPQTSSKVICMTNFKNA